MGSAILTILSIFCVIFLDVTGIKVLLTMNQFRGGSNVNHNRVMKRIALLFIVSTVGILMVTFTIVSFLTQFPYTPWVREEKNKISKRLKKFKKKKKKKKKS